MSTRIPSSLKWLIDKRARLDAEIQKTQSSLVKAKKLLKELSNLKKSLSAIDQALSLHEIEVDVSLIQPVKTQYKRINLPHGELTRSILMCLRLYEGKRPVGMSEIAAFISSRYPNLSDDNLHRITLSRSVHYRLKDLAARGVIVRHHDPKSSHEGIWSLADEEDV